MKKVVFLVCVGLFLIVCKAHSQDRQVEHPRLLLTPEGVAAIRQSLGHLPAFDRSVEALRQVADQALKAPVEVPFPKDGGGGYTHEKHKANYHAMYCAGIAYQLYGEEKYARWVKQMLEEYARLYPQLGLHPAQRSATPGKLFWQALNEAAWLVSTAVAYDCVYDYIPAAGRRQIEEQLFYPMAAFISEGNEENYKTFNKMHNHATWATAAVGMIGYVMNDRDLSDRALYGSDKSGKGGFVRQLDELFSPDGYYTEGPYYQRYAINPFVTFAQAIQHCQPELKIFEHRDHILVKAIHALLNMAYKGEFFYLNDALPKTYETQELINATNILYSVDTTDKSLLDIIAAQPQYQVSEAGLKAARAISRGEARPFMFRPMMLKDGKKGEDGGLAILRKGTSGLESCLVFKATSHGLSHGHFDKLSYVFYDNGHTILQDYGAVRFLNIVSKFGGHYTAENKTWAKQTISHNTLVADERSHFGGNYEESFQHAPHILYFDASRPEIQIVSAEESQAYPGIVMQRTMALISDEHLDAPVVVDFLKAVSAQQHTYDLPFYYLGQLVDYDFKVLRAVDRLEPLGKANGYQHLWVEGRGQAVQPTAAFTWVNANRFYTVTTSTPVGTELIFVRLGANDPDFNLRHDPGVIVRRRSNTASFVSVIEPHGNYDLVKEVTQGDRSQVEKLEVVAENEQYTAIRIAFRNKSVFVLLLAHRNQGEHSLKIEGKTYRWKGYYELIKE